MLPGNSGSAACVTSILTRGPTAWGIGYCWKVAVSTMLLCDVSFYFWGVGGDVLRRKACRTSISGPGIEPRQCSNSV